MKLPAPDAAGRTTPLESQAPSAPGAAVAAPAGQPFETLIDKRAGRPVAIVSQVEMPPICPPPPETPPPDRTLVEQVLGVEEDREDEPWTTSVLIVPTALLPDLPIDSSRTEDATQPLALVAGAPPEVELVLAGDGPTTSPLDGNNQAGTDRTSASPFEADGTVTSGQLPVIATSSDVLLSEISPEPTAITGRPGESVANAGPSSAAGTEALGAPPVKLLPEVVSPTAVSRAADAQPVTVDTARLIHRVARSFAAVHHGSGAIRMKLSPPALGALQLEVLVEDGKLTARLATETAEVQRAIVEGLPALRERLAEQGIRIERFEVDLLPRQHSGTPQQSPDQHSHEQSNAPRPRLRRLPQVAEGVVARTARPGELDSKRLNVIV